MMMSKLNQKVELWLVIFTTLWIAFDHSLLLSADDNDNCQQNTRAMMQIQYTFKGDRRNNTFDIRCSAVALNRNWLLTLSSCMFDSENPSRYSVKKNRDTIVVKNIIKNPSYNNELGSGYDIALLYVENHIVMEDECFPVLISNGKYDELNCMIVKRDNSKAELTFNSMVARGSISTNCIHSSMVKSTLVQCAESTAPGTAKGICQDEAGAILICRSLDSTITNGYVLRAISSWGDLRCQTNPYLFTLMDPYTSWIKSYIDKGI